MKTFAWILCACALAACSGKPEAPAPAPEPSAQAAPASTPFDTLRATEQKAKGVQKMVDDAAARQRKAIDGQGK